MTTEESTYISSVLQKLIDIPMVREIKVDPKYCMLNHATGKAFVQYMVIDLDQVIITPPDTKHPNWPKTVDAMKYLIDWQMCEIHNFYIEFNKEFSKFRKIKIN